MKTVCILPGFSEGRHQSKEFRQAITNAGYSLIEDPNKADTLITHSGGCYLVPEDTEPKLMLMIGPAYCPYKSKKYASLQKVKWDFKWYHREGRTHHWSLKTFWNILYGLRHVRVFYVIMHGMRTNRLAHIVKQGKRTIVIRNLNDPWCNPNVGKLLDVEQINIPGEHDDCWVNPNRYIELLPK